MKSERRGERKETTVPRGNVIKIHKLLLIKNVTSDTNNVSSLAFRRIWAYFFINYEFATRYIVKKIFLRILHNGLVLLIARPINGDTVDI